MWVVDVRALDLVREGSRLSKAHSQRAGCRLLAEVVLEDY